MALISSSSLIRFLSLFHLTIAYYLLNSPQTIADQGLVVVFGEAMKIVRPSPSYADCTAELA